MASSPAFSQTFSKENGEQYIEIITPQVRPVVSTMNKFLGLSQDAELYMTVYMEVEDTIVGVDSHLVDSHKFSLRKDVGKTFMEETDMHFIPFKVGYDNKLSHMGYHVKLQGIEEMPEQHKNFPLTIIFKSGTRIEIPAKTTSPRG